MKRSGVVLLLLALPGAVVLACSSFGESTTAADAGSNDNEAGGDAIAFAPDAASSADAIVPDSAKRCPSIHGPSMVRIARLDGTPGEYCVDSTEVTQAQYQAFLDATDRPAQVPKCATNILVPTCTGGPTFFTPDAGPDLPVTCVDLCDARHFCAWSGKRLCGALPAAVDAGDQANASSEWFNACSRFGTRLYAWGSNDAPSTCNFGSSAPAPVRSKPSCQGGFDGLFDMSGNVYEWDDDCTVNVPQYCRVRGGAFDTTDDPGRRCDFDHGIPSNEAYPDIGFRCCADPK